MVFGGQDGAHLTTWQYAVLNVKIVFTLVGKV